MFKSIITSYKRKRKERDTYYTLVNYLSIFDDFFEKIKYNCMSISKSFFDTIEVYHQFDSKDEFSQHIKIRKEESSLAAALRLVDQKPRFIRIDKEILFGKNNLYFSVSTDESHFSKNYIYMGDKDAFEFAFDDILYTSRDFEKLKRADIEQLSKLQWVQDALSVVHSFKVAEMQVELEKEKEKQIKEQKKLDIREQRLNAKESRYKKIKGEVF